jgi:DNA-binding NarL/FixJ family response regulator
MPHRDSNHLDPQVAASPRIRGDSRIRVLIVDDDRIFGHAVTMHLERDDRIHVLGIAHDGLAGLELALEHEPDVVIMDVRLPRLGGPDTARRLLVARPSTRIVLMSASDREDLASDAAGAGVAAWLPKERVHLELVDLILSIARHPSG